MNFTNWLLNKRTIWYVLFFAFLVRILLVLLTDPYGSDTVDGFDYHNHAISLLNGEGYPNRGSLPFMRPPLYPMLLSIVYFFVPHDSYLTARLVNVVLDVAACLMFYKLIILVWNSLPTALISSLIYAINPLFLFFSVRVRVEALFTLLVVSGVYLLIREYKLGFKRLSIVILIGVLFGLCVLCRSNAMAFLPLVPAWLVVCNRKSWRSALLLSAVFLVASILTVLPWSLRNYERLGEPVLVTDGFGYNFWISNTELKFDDLYARTHDEYLAADSKVWRSLGEIERELDGRSIKERDDHYFRIGLQYIRDDFPRWIWLNLLKFLEFWSPMARYDMQGVKALITLPFGVFMYLGLFFFVKNFFSQRFDRNVWYLFALSVVVATGTGVLTWSSVRFRVPLVDAYIIPFGVYWLQNRFGLFSGEVET